jgi:hypothetical protein
VTAQLTCTACGHQGYDVSTKIVERKPTPDDARQYKAEPRCIDREACQDRQYAREPA